MTGIYSLEDFNPFLQRRPTHGKLEPLPNVEDVDPLLFLNNLAAGGHMMEPVWGYTLLPGGDRYQWTQCFLTRNSNMSMELDGGGYAVTYGGSRYVPAEGDKPSQNIQQPIVRRFAICKHEKEDGPGANHSRGWHPGRCKKCGMDMTIDSGD